MNLDYFVELYLVNNSLESNNDFLDFQEELIEEGLNLSKFLNFSNSLKYYSNDKILENNEIKELVYFNFERNRYETKRIEITRAVERLKNKMSKNK